MDIHSGEKNLKNLSLDLSKLQNQLNQLQGRNNLPIGEVEVKVHLNSGGKGDIVLRYQVANAGWYPVPYFLGSRRGKSSSALSGSCGGV